MEQYALFRAIHEVACSLPPFQCLPFVPKPETFAHDSEGEEALAEWTGRMVGLGFKLLVGDVQEAIDYDGLWVRWTPTSKPPNIFTGLPIRYPFPD